MTDVPEDWVLIKAQKLCGWTAIGSPEQLRLRYKTAGQYSSGSSFAALCDMIAKYEQPPVDRKLLCAREAMAECCVLPESEGAYRRGAWDHADALKRCLRAIELYLEGYGK